MHEVIANIFNQTFSHKYNTRLAGGYSEPFYRAPADSNPGLICYREDFASSALHEAAHWCIAGAERRALDDFGYWYSPDGRDADQQRAFEQVEVKPQALEWLFSLASGIVFRVSADNLSASSGASLHFAREIYDQAISYLERGLPGRAELFLVALSSNRGFPTPQPTHVRFEDLAL